MNWGKPVNLPIWSLPPLAARFAKPCDMERGDSPPRACARVKKLAFALYRGRFLTFQMS